MKTVSPILTILVLRNFIPLLHVYLKNTDDCYNTLPNRVQYCRVNDVHIKIEDIIDGVLQRSCLNSIIFVVYIEDVPVVVNHYTTSMYANDTSLCIKSKDLPRLI